MNGYVQNHLNPGEQVVYEAHLHWMIYLGPVILLGFGTMSLLTGMALGGLGIAAVGLIWLLMAWIQQQTSEFAITDKRVIIKVGWLSRRTVEINMSRVESVQVDQGIFARMLNYGTIVVVGTGGTKESFVLIDDPLAFRKAVQAQLG